MEVSISIGGVKDSEADGKNVCFTSFADEDDSLLKVMSELAGMRVQTKVDSRLRYLVIGPKTKGNKADSARECGADILSEEEFESICEKQGVTKRHAEDVIQSLRSGNISTDKLPSRNIGFCPHCQAIAIPFPRIKRKCFKCKEVIIPFMRRLWGEKELIDIFHILDRIKRIVCPTCGAEVGSIEKFIDAEEYQDNYVEQGVNGPESCPQCRNTNLLFFAGRVCTEETMKEVLDQYDNEYGIK